MNLIFDGDFIFKFPISLKNVLKFFEEKNILKIAILNFKVLEFDMHHKLFIYVKIEHI